MRHHHKGEKRPDMAKQRMSRAARDRESIRRLSKINADLLEALVESLCALECCGKDYPAASKARTAIARARGES